MLHSSQHLLPIAAASVFLIAGEEINAHNFTDKCIVSKFSPGQDYHWIGIVEGYVCV